jgi:hypothetical protein
VTVASDRVRALAGSKARELNLPWDAGRVSVKRPVLGALLGVWIVTSTSPLEGGDVTAVIRVNERTSTATPVRVRYRRSERGGSLWFFSGQVAIGVPVAVLVFLGTTRLLGVSVFLAVILAIAWAFLAMVFTVRFRKL